MRHRSRNQTFTTPDATSQEVNSITHQTLNWTWTSRVNVPMVTETIDDETGAPYRFKSVSHSKSLLDIPVYAGSNSRGAGRVYTFNPYALFNRAYSVAAAKTALDGVPVTIPSDWSRYSSYAMQSMLPSLESNVSLVNFILELKDLAHMVKSFRQNVKANKVADGQPKTYTVLSGLYDRKRTVAQNAANLYLSYQFGIKPFIDDVSSIVKSLWNLREKIRRLRALAGTIMVRHYRCAMGGFTLPATSVVYSEGGTNYQVTRRHSWRQYPVYTATCCFVYEMPDMNWLELGVKGTLDALGVNANLAIPWNHIRFSFLIDWFSSVSDWLDVAGDHALVKFPVRIIDFCHSAKFEVQNELLDSDYGTQRVVATRVISGYTRLRGFPSVGAPMLRDSDLNMRKVSLGLSLLVANGPSSYKVKSRK